MAGGARDDDEVALRGRGHGARARCERGGRPSRARPRSRRGAERSGASGPGRRGEGGSCGGGRGRPLATLRPAMAPPRARAGVATQRCRPVPVAFGRCRPAPRAASTAARPPTDADVALSRLAALPDPRGAALAQDPDAFAGRLAGLASLLGGDAERAARVASSRPDLLLQPRNALAARLNPALSAALPGADAGRLVGHGPWLLAADDAARAAGSRAREDGRPSCPAPRGRPAWLDGGTAWLDVCGHLSGRAPARARLRGGGAVCFGGLPPARCKCCSVRRAIRGRGRAAACVAGSTRLFEGLLQLQEKSHCSTYEPSPFHPPHPNAPQCGPPT